MNIRAISGAGVRPTEAEAPPSAIGRILLRRGLVSARRLHDAEIATARQDARLMDTLRLGLALPAAKLAEAEAELAGAALIDPVQFPPDQRLFAACGPALCLRHGLLPWRRVGGATVVLTSRPDQFARHRDSLSLLLGPIRMAVAREDRIHTALQRRCGPALARAAEARVAGAESCRGWDYRKAQMRALTALAVIAALLIVAPVGTLALVTAWAVLTLALSTALKVAATVIHLRSPAAPRFAANPVPARLPVVSILVPLFRERAIASHLLARLSAIDYPHELLDVCLVLEADDLTTRAALDETNLPRWMRAVTVPHGVLKTKPRALNYALDFARGSIVGVYDAEDAPDPAQIRAVVARFAQVGPDVACLQGILDFYNAESNWLARCFTIEYATWFRIVLPGLEKLGLVLPLGGTTLFFRRDVLESLGGWDAHNVTEDADLGLRLARHGYRTEMIQTVTDEEANARLWPWVKQRSRWLKGYAITYGVHMRNPARLWRELGAWRFFGVQLLFLGTLSQFALAPLLWSFWLLPLGFGHPLTGLLPWWMFVLLGSIFLVSEVINIAVSAIAVTRAGKPRLIKWTLTLHLYFPLAAVASYKGLWELTRRPFYWDKTAHGIFAPTVSRPAAPLPRPVSGG